MNTHCLKRRAVTMALMLSVLPKVNAQGIEADRANTFVIDAGAVKTLADLIGAMKAAAGPLLPSSLPLEEYYKAISKAFVENAHAAAAAGIKGIPPALLAKIPKRRVVFPILVAVVIMGVTFLVPLQTLVWAVIGSLAVLTVFIHKAIVALQREGRLKA
jgi:hypothetical protein